MKTFDLIQSVISHDLKDPHSKALEPECLSPCPPIATQPPRGKGLWGFIYLILQLDFHEKKFCIPLSFNSDLQFSGDLGCTQG